MSKEDLFQLPSTHREMFEINIHKYLNRINKTVFRRTHKEAFDCAAECCDAPFTRSSDFHDCTDICVARLFDQRDYAQTTIDQFRISVQLCSNSCKEEAMKIYSKGQYREAVEMFNKCTYKCIQEHMFRLPQLIEEIVQQMQLRYIKFTPDVPN